MSMSVWGIADQVDAAMERIEGSALYGTAAPEHRGEVRRGSFACKGPP